MRAFSWLKEEFEFIFDEHPRGIAIWFIGGIPIIVLTLLVSRWFGVAIIFLAAIAIAADPRK